MGGQEAPGGAAVSLPPGGRVTGRRGGGWPQPELGADAGGGPRGGEDLWQVGPSPLRWPAQGGRRGGGC